MDEGDIDARVAQVLVGLMQVRRALYPASLDALLGAVLAEIRLGIDLVEERALEHGLRRRIEAIVLPFPTPANDTAAVAPSVA